MIIAFPPCTDLAVSGSRWFAEKRADGRQQRSIAFFMLFTDLKCPRVAVENPISIMSSHYRKPDQIIQPWMFGDEYTKSTCLWLKGLPLLTPTAIVGKGSFTVTKTGKKIPEWLSSAKGAHNGTRGHERSKTFGGIADAMATQWTVGL